MEDEKIVYLIYNRDENGIIETKKKYETLLNSLSYEIIRNKEDASECVNDTYLKIWHTIPPYKPNYFKSFICKIVRQISLDKYRFNHREMRKNNSIPLTNLDYQISDFKNIDDELSNKILIDTINTFVLKIDIESRVLFVRRYFFFENTKSLSKRYGMSETNINVKLFRIKKKLKKYLEREGYLIEKI